jgi:RNA polymerase sigma-70 factor, ECF subfamily
VEVADSELASRARTGDSSAFSTLIRRHERAMLAIAYACTGGDSATAADVVQDAFLRCWTRIDTLREPERFAPWLATTVRNLSANAIRSLSRKVRLAEDHVLDGRPVDAPVDPIEAADTADRVARAIATLDETSAAVVTLRYYEDLPSKQIAELLELTPAAVDMRLSRARQTLKTLLEEQPSA